MVSVNISGLTKSYGDTTVLPELDLNIAEGEFVTLLGPSGCGKTTTLRCVAGLERPTSGRISFDDKVVVDGNGRFVPPNKRGIGMVFQSYALWPHMTVFGNVEYPLRSAHVPSAQRGPLVREALERVGLGKMATRSVGTLSGGQQQRVALARATVGHPRLILFDEPLSNLDAKLRASMRAELQLLHRKLGTTSLYVTHDQTEAMTLSDRIVVLNRGIIQQVGSPEEIYTTPVNPFVADFVGFENIINGTVVGDDAVRIADGTVLSGRAMHPLTSGSPAQVAFRSNAVAIEPDPASSAVVLSSTFLGDQREFLIDVGGEQVRARLDAHSPSSNFEIGDRVVVRPRPSAVLIYDGEVPTSTTAVAIGALTS